MPMAHSDANWESRRLAGETCLRRQDGGSPSQGGSDWESRRLAGDIPYLSAEFPDAMNSASSHFSSTLSQTEVTKHNLPHWGQSGVIVFITFRLADSLPTNLLAQWQAERDEWIAKHPEPWDVIVSQEYAAQFPNRLEEWLDAGHGNASLVMWRIGRLSLLPWSILTGIVTFFIRMSSCQIIFMSLWSSTNGATCRRLCTVGKVLPRKKSTI